MPKSKKKKPSQQQLIREYLRKHPDAGIRQVRKALRMPNLYSSALTAARKAVGVPDRRLANAKPRAGAPEVSPKSSSAMSADKQALLSVFNLVDKVGLEKTIKLVELVRQVRED